MTVSSSHEQYLHLVRLAWGLHELEVKVRIELPAGEEPYVSVRRESGPLRVLALVRDKKWVFVWGRGRRQWVAAFDADAVRHIHELVAR